MQGTDYFISASLCLKYFKMKHGQQGSIAAAYKSGLLGLVVGKGVR
jgi:hypothetical protein